MGDKEKMKILLINHYAGSLKHGMEYRPFYLAHEWVQMGHQVHIVAASYSHVREKNIRLNKNTKTEEIEGIIYTWLKTPSYHGNGIGRVWNMLIFTARLFIFGRYLSQNYAPDVVIASSTYPLDIFPAHRIARKGKAKLVYEVHDLWPLTPMELGRMSKFHPFIVLLQFAENFACRNSDKIVSMLPKADEHLRLHGMKRDRFFYVPNGIVPGMWQENEKIPQDMKKAIEHLKNDKQFLVGYTGGHGVSNALEVLVEAARILKEENVAFVFVGKGPEKENLKEKALSMNLGNVYFFDSVKKTVIPALLKEFDVLYLGWRRSPLYRFGISPNKLMDYMISARPVVHAVEAANDAVKAAKCGISVEPENPVAVANAILKLKNLPEKEREDMGRRGKEYVLKNHDYKILARKFLEALE